MNEQEVNAHIAPGVCATLWTPRSMDETLTPRVLSILRTSCPQIVCLHGMVESHQSFAEKVWKDLLIHARETDWRPRLWIGVACDGVIRKVIEGRATIEQGARELALAAFVADSIGAELVCWDAEAACKLAPATASAIASYLIGLVRVRHPTLVQAHTAYAIPTYHSEFDEFGKRLPHGYPWTAWCGPDGVDVDLPELYVAPEEPAEGTRPFASPGALQLMLQRHAISWRAAIKLGWIRENMPVWMYGQLHHVPCTQTITYASDPRRSPWGHNVGVNGHVFVGWTVEKDRCDEHGEMSLRVLSDLARRGQTLTEFQQSVGLAPDGIMGPNTARALGLTLPPIPG